MDDRIKKITMDNISIKKELPIWILIVIPFVYLAYIWGDLPEQVPIHFSGNGEPDKFRSRKSLIFITGFMTLFMYALLTLLPQLDPKNKLAQMGNKYQQLKFLLMLFMSILGLTIIHSALTGRINPKITFTIIGVLFTVLGNFFQAIRHNYFVGIRTPWTLESEFVWKQTHKAAGPLWMLGGITISAISFALPANLVGPSFIGIIGILCIVPIVHSYILFKREKGK